MALLESNALNTGFKLPDFELPEVKGGSLRSADMNGKVAVVMFICAHCPYVIAVEDRFVELAKSYAPEDVSFAAICSNDATDYPEDRPEALAERAARKGYPFPYLVDETQDVAKAFEAVCTPEFYVFDQERTLVYHGRLDDNWKDASAVTQKDLAAAIDAALAGQPAPAEQYPSMGCSIKWKK